MKYDRPVSELLAECVSQLPQPFTRNDIIEWFRRNYPDVASSTVSAHIQGLTEGPSRSTSFPHLATFRPVLERVGRGLYRRAGGTAGKVPSDQPSGRPRESGPRPPDTQRGGVVLVGCVKTKADTARPARDLYQSPLFAKRRAYAERSGLPWFVISSRWGLIDPDEVVAPYDVYLADQPASYRRAWGEFVVAQLAATTQLSGRRVEIHAGDAYVQAVTPALERAGAIPIDRVTAGSMGETLAWYDKAAAGVPSATSDPYTPGTDLTRTVSELVDRLQDPTRAVSVAQLLLSSRSDLAHPGLYLWWVDAAGSADLSAGLGQPVTEGPIYGGQAGATRWPSGTPSSNTLGDRLVGMHLRGTTSISTFRHTLTAIIGSRLTMGGSAVEALTAWMGDHLRVSTAPCTDPDSLRELERYVLQRLNPPLNLDGMPPSPVRSALTRLRRNTGS